MRNKIIKLIPVVEFWKGVALGIVIGMVMDFVNVIGNWVMYQHFH